MAAQVEPERLDAETRKNRRHFLLRKLHSLSGVLPVGVFLIEHLWTNSKAVQGRVCFSNAVEDIIRLPFLPAIEIFGIFLPLAFHALYGLKLAFESKPNVGRYGYGRNWMFFLQRITGLVTLVFIAFHLKDFRLAKLLGTMQHGQFFAKLSDLLGTSRFQALFYELGVTASVFHFANGLRTFLFSWGVTISAKSQRYATWAVSALGAGLWFLGTNTVLFFSTGGPGGTFVPTSLVRGQDGRDMCEETLTPAAGMTSAQPAVKAPPAAVN